MLVRGSWCLTIWDLNILEDTFTRLVFHEGLLLHYIMSLLAIKHSLIMLYHPTSGPVLGGAGQWTDGPQSPTDAHRSGAGCMLERRRSHLVKSFKPCNRCRLLGHRIIYDVLFSSTRMEVKSSLLPVTKQPRCGILTATKRCRLLRLDKSPQINYEVIRMKQKFILKLLTICFHSTTARSKQSTG